MNFIIDAEQMNSENLFKASVYLDACFILAFLDKTDSRRLDVADALDVWAENEVRLGYSNHTFTEVTSRLFQMLILGSIQVYHEKKQLLHHTRDGFDKLSDRERTKLMNVDSAKYLYRVAKNEDILRFYKREVSANVGELVKRAKEDQNMRYLLDIYYHSALNIFNQFIRKLKEELEFEVELLSEGFEENELAKVHMQLTQLDPTDSIHLAIARMNGYSYLATLDSDFVHNYYSNIDGLDMKIIKVA
ncbi:hypothetical protein [Bacillus sp. FJAT-47783]|uniref:hypothetical protein n=1 Tax=Bacillus sp. FJAT-47783 TaxID=2922712 RepID=UPI001FACE890|nr:hypothetical protein [Bacillus sp. FJAT-47783]